MPPKSASAKSSQPRILIIGAHPDDCDVVASGLAVMGTRAGVVVKFLSLTNGDTGHHEIGGGQLARRRYAETQASARIAGIEYQVIDQHCGELEPSLHHRKNVIRIIREFRPDLIMTHTPDDYHPDHRYTSILVQDSAYLVTVPGMCPLTPHLRHNPIFAYIQGTVTTSSLFRPTVAVDVTPVLAKKLAMLRCHESQFLEWIPYNRNCLDQVPADKAGRRRFQDDFWKARFVPFAEVNRDLLATRYGKARAGRAKAVEAIAPCPFGAPLTPQAIARILPFLPSQP